MAKLYFNYSTMNAGKSTSLLQASYNYREGGMQTYLVTAQFDNRAGEGRIQCFRAPLQPINHACHLAVNYLAATSRARQINQGTSQ